MKTGTPILGLILVLLFLNAIPTVCLSQNKQKTLSKIQTNDDTEYIDSKFIRYWLANNGRGATDPFNGHNLGFYFPKGGPKSAIFADGFVFAGYVQTSDTTSELRSGGGTYVAGLQAGRIIKPGKLENGIYTPPSADDPTSEHNRIYKLVKNMATLPENDILTIQRKKDYIEWPIEGGAPIDENGSPLLMGDEELFYVSNDLDSTRTKKLYGSKPIGIEVQTTIWTTEYPLNMGFVFFVKKKLINKSGLPIKDFYMSIWSDPDLGDASDDLAGYDSTYQLGYVYNGRTTDATYRTGSVPSVGYSLIQTPLQIGAAIDTAYLNGNSYPGYKNIKASSFVFYIGAGPADYSDPPIGTNSGTVLLYRYMRGLNALGNPFLDNNGNITKFLVPGDPVTKTGDIDGVKFGIADRRIMLSVGPFNFNKSDTQEIVYAVLIGQGKDNLHSIEVLRKNAGTARNVYQDHEYFADKISRINAHSVGLNKKIMLYWGDSENANTIENSKTIVPKFEGYNIYQFEPNKPLTKQNAKKIATYDVKNDITKIKSSVVYDESGDEYFEYLQNGNNSGVSHYFETAKDFLTDSPIVNSVDYVFGISYYFYRKAKYTEYAIESEIQILPVTPKPFFPGYRNSNENSVIPSVKKFDSGSSAFVKPVVIDPSKITGHIYSIKINETDIEGKPKSWVLKDEAISKTLFSSSEFQEGKDNFIEDGILWQLINKDESGNDLGLNASEYWEVNTEQSGFSFSEQKAKSDLSKINVYPNPYFGASIYDRGKFDKEITFTNLPERATIRIFTLSGSHIMTINKNDKSSIVKWNTLNDHRWIIASGIYVVHIETDFGTKVLKMAVISEVPILDNI